MKRVALVLLLFPCIVYGQATGRDGKTFQQRKSAYLNNILPDPSSISTIETRKIYFPAWLEKGIYNDLVSQTTQYIIGDWWSGKAGQYSHHAYMVFAIRKYGNDGSNLITDSDERDIKNSYKSWIEGGNPFRASHPQKQMNKMVGIYLYTKYYEDLDFPLWGVPTYIEDPDSTRLSNNWPTFTYNGNTYKFNAGPYNANRAAKDWIEYRLDSWYVRKIEPEKQREFDSFNYFRGFPFSMSVLIAALDAGDPLRRKAKMAFELCMLDAVMDHGNSNGLGGTIGRSQYSYTGRNMIFAIYPYWGMSKDEGRFDIKAAWSLDVELPDLIVDLGILTDENDSYYHWHKEFNNDALAHKPNRGKWNFVTKHYSIGSSDGHRNQGWQVVINAGNVSGPDTKMIRFWINGTAVEPASSKESAYLGHNGRQFKNAIFADIGGTPYYRERLVGRGAWDTEVTEGGWRFKKVGKTMVAIGMGSQSASVELATEGVEYADFNAFKAAVRNNAELKSDYYISSRSLRINRSDYCGLNVPGDCVFPFKRMETIDNKGNMIVQWKNNVMTVSRHGRSLFYDFNNWEYWSGNAVKDKKRPDPPKDVSAKESR